MNFTIMLEGERINSLKELGEKIYLHDEASEKLLTSNKFLDFLKKYDLEKYQQLIDLNHQEREYQRFIFLAQYIFNPTMNIRYHKYSFQTFKEFGEKILSFAPEIDIYLLDFVKYHLLSKYMELTKFDKRDPDLYNKVIEIEKIAEINLNKAYFFLGFTLSGCDIITYENKKYDNVDLFFKDMTSEFHIAKYSSLLDKNQYVLSYLSFHGLNDVVNKYQSLTQSINTLEENYEYRTKNTKMEK